MSELSSLQRAFAGVLMDRADPAPLEARVLGDERASAAERVAIYTHMYRARLTEVLAQVYPRTRALVGEEAFAALAEAYVSSHPSRSPSLRPYGDRFSFFLRGAAAHPAAPSLARLEWARYEVFDAEDEPVLARGQLAGLGRDAIAALPLRTIAASRLVDSTHDLDSLYRALAKDEVPAEGAATPMQLLVWRDGTTVYHRVVPAREAEQLARLSGGLPLGHLCEALAADQPIERAAAEAFALVGRWVADGLLVATA